MEGEAIKIIVGAVPEITRRALSGFFSQLPQVTTLGTVGSNEEALAAASDPAVDVIAIQPTHDTLDPNILSETLRSMGKDIPLLVLIGRTSTQEYGKDVVKGLQAGAISYLSLDTPVEALYHILQLMKYKVSVITPELRDAASQHLAVANRFTALGYGSERLTSREWEVLHLLGRGYANKEISAELGIAMRTVEVHVGRLMEKLNARSRSDLLIKAVHLSETTMAAQAPGG
ncbi:MAG: response regulator transcription factor [Nitrospirales bacterium]